MLYVLRKMYIYIIVYSQYLLRDQNNVQTKPYYRLGYLGYSLGRQILKVETK